MTTTNPMIVQPGETLRFRYLGELIPNQVLFKNLGGGATSFNLTGAPPAKGDWTLADMPVAPNATLSLLVIFPATVFAVKNTGKSPIGVSGDGIFPADESAAK